MEPPKLGEEQIVIPKVPENVLKIRKERLDEKESESKKKRIEALKKRKEVKRRTKFVTPQQFIKDFRRQERDHFRILRQGSRRNNVVLETWRKSGATSAPSSTSVTGSSLAHPSIALAVRLSTQMLPTNPKTRNALKYLRLLTQNHAAFVKLNASSLAMLAIAEPFITWGRPTIQTIRDLITRRGTTTGPNGARVPLSNNVIVEEKLGDKGIICIDDLVHEVCTLGPNFDAVNQFLGNFVLQKSDKPLKRKRLHFGAGGEHGDRGEKINDLIKLMI